MAAIWPINFFTDFQMKNKKSRHRPHLIIEDDSFRIYDA